MSLYKRYAFIAPQAELPEGYELPSTAPVEYDAGNYVLPTVNLEKGELFAFYTARPKWQRRLSWLIPTWRKARVYRGDDVKVQRLTDPDRIRISGPSGGPYWVDDLSE